MFNQEFFIMFIPKFIEIFTELCLIGILAKTKLKTNITKIIFSSLILIIFTHIFSICIPRYYLPFITCFLFFIASSIIYKSPILKTLFSTIITTLLLVILDFIVAMIFIALNFNHLYSPTLLTTIIGNIFFIFLLILTTFYIYYKNLNLSVQDNYSRINFIPLVSNILVTFFLILPNILIVGIYYQKQTLPLSIIFVNITAIILSFFLSIYNTNKNTSLIRTEQELEFQKNYTSTLENLVDSLRTFKHDFNNTLQLLYGYIQIESIDGLKKTFQQVLDESKTINSLSKLNPDKIKNPHLYGLLSAKNNLAVENNISLDINIDADIKDIDMKIFDFSRILGIFLDNAIEATLDAKYKKICFNMKEQNNCIEILIQNTYNQLALSTTEIFDKGKSSKGENRGLGLYEVKRLLSRYKNSTLNTYTEDCYFCQKLSIPLVKETINV